MSVPFHVARLIVIFYIIGASCRLSQTTISLFGTNSLRDQHGLSRMHARLVFDKNDIRLPRWLGGVWGSGLDVGGVL